MAAHPDRVGQSDAIASTSAQPAFDRYPSRRRGYYVLAIFVLAMILSYADRVILAMLVDPVRASLGISDFEISLLYGLAFGVCFTVMGVPMGWLADRWNRRNLIAGGLVIFSLATAVTGVARSFSQMFVARLALGLGEATLNPAAYSLLADYFPPSARPRVFSIYLSSAYVGAGLATLGAGVLIASVAPAVVPGIGLLEPWQIIFIGLGLLGIPMFLLLMTVKELPRIEATGSRQTVETVTFRDTLRHVRARRGAYLTTTAGYAIFTVVVFAYNAWLPALMMRNYAWPPAALGGWLGLITIAGGVGGALSGSAIAGFFRGRGHSDANIRVGFWAALLTVPFAVFAPLMPNGAACLLIYAGVMYAGSLPFGVAIAAILEITPNRMRGQISALFFLGINLLGLAGGPALVGGLADYVFDHDIGRSLAMIGASLAPLAAVLIGIGMKSYRSVIAQQHALE